MPIHWKEVKSTLKPERFDIRTAPELLRKTGPWGGYDEAARSLAAAIEKVLER
jgi:bifunctional non-homologous end joining protein LigD